MHCVAIVIHLHLHLWFNGRFDYASKAFWTPYLFQKLSSSLLKELTDLALTTYAGKLFHVLITHWVKNSCLHLSAFFRPVLNNFILCPLVSVVLENLKNLSASILSKPCRILNVSIMSPRSIHILPILSDHLYVCMWYNLEKPATCCTGQSCRNNKIILKLLCFSLFFINFDNTVEAY